MIKKKQKKKENKLKLPEKKKKEKVGLKKDTGMRVARYIFWGLLIFIFLKGIIHMLTPNTDADEIRKMLNDFKVQYEENTEENEGVYSFAQNFVKEYLTYSNDFEEDHKERIKKYVSDEIYNTQLLDFKGNSEVTYVEAYKKEKYSKNQVDVYVVADVRYSIQKISEDGENYDTLIKTGTSIVKVPIYMKGNKYIVEDVPAFINDDMKLKSHELVEYAGEEITEQGEVQKVQEFLKNFFKAYYEEEQSVIAYYLKQGVNENEFLGLRKRYLFEEITNCKLYQDNTVTVSIKIKDSINKTTMLQAWNLKIIKDGERYYIEKMNTKTSNLQ